MADAYTTILCKTDPFVLDTTVGNLESISSGSNYPLPLGSTPSAGDTDEDRPFLHTPFNKVDDSNYRSPWKASKSSDTDIVELEHTANEVWDAYRQLYYGHEAIGSVFVRRKGSGSDSKKGGVLEALFGIQKTCMGDSETQEISRWESVHTVTIEVPNFDEKTCEYTIQSAVWCRYKPEDVGDVPPAERPKKAAPSPKKKAFSPKKFLSKLDVARLEVFDKAANNWDSKGNKQKPSEPVQTGDPLAPIPAVVTSSAVYTKDTNKICKLSLTKSAKTIPVASHIQNIGSLIEKIEADFRSKLERVDAPKCVEVLQAMYRPTLSPGLKLPSGTSSSGQSMISKLGGHATGMGVGKGLIGEIALKAKSKGLGGGAEDSKNKAMEHILANEKKKLQEPSKAPSTWNKSGLKKSEKPEAAAAKDMAADAAGFLKQTQLRKAGSVRTAEPSTTAPTPEFMNFRSKLKSTAAK